MCSGTDIIFDFYFVAGILVFLRENEFYPTLKFNPALLQNPLFRLF